MSALTGDDLLEGPRGRGLCMAVAHRVDEQIWSAWLDAAWNLGDTARLNALVRALQATSVDLDGVWRHTASFLEPVAESVGQAMYWQPPHDEDAILAVPAVRAALRPLASAIAASSATAWWSSPVDLNALRYTNWSVDRPSAPAVTGSGKRLLQWRAQTVAEKAAFEGMSGSEVLVSDHWWSAPTMHALVSTTRPMADLGSIELAWHEDSLGIRDALIWPLETVRSPRVWEIDKPQAWVELVQAYPLDVTEQRRYDWGQVTNRRGRWCIPDWSTVAGDWDAVHLSVAGYLTTATRALPLADATSATMLAGWNPDQTWWLTHSPADDDRTGTVAQHRRLEWTRRELAPGRLVLKSSSAARTA